MLPPLIARQAENRPSNRNHVLSVMLRFSLAIAITCGVSFAAATAPTDNSSTSVSDEGTQEGSTSSVSASYFGFQCGIGDTEDCEGPGGESIVWPTTKAQPGLLRLHDAGTHWASIDQGNGSYYWSTLNQWLDVIAQHQPVTVIQTFAWVPCYLVKADQCSAPPTAPTGTNVPPGDLNASGSLAFNNFVTQFVQHCSPNGNCVKDLIKQYEMWNEWDIQFHWTGTMEQVYNMVKPAVAIIRANVPKAIILTPTATPDSNTGLGYETDFQNWLNYENTQGRISDWVAWHVYLTKDGNSATETDTPEAQWAKYNAHFLSIQSQTPGWQNTPWENAETNFNGAPPPGLNYTCPLKQYTPQDCTGQVVRWQLLHLSNGAQTVSWYKWRPTVGLNNEYENAYYYMMQYLVGGKFSSPCAYVANEAIQVQTWTCKFTESNGTTASWVWTPSEKGESYTVPSGYTDYRDLTGGTINVNAGQKITIGPIPIMLEKKD